MSEPTVDLHIRVPESLAKKLKASADTSLRSLTAQVIFLLGKALK